MTLHMPSAVAAGGDRIAITLTWAAIRTER
jgi:hypothetical protein